MIADAAASGRPVWLYLPPRRPSLQYRINHWSARNLGPLHRLLLAVGLLPGMRDLDRLLVSWGLALAYEAMGRTEDAAWLRAYVEARAPHATALHRRFATAR